jgi:N-acetylglucosamine-6-phosphate deacetylase
MPALVIRNATLVLPDGMLPGGALRVEGDTITAVGSAAGAVEPGAEELDAGGLYLAPGLIDLQLNGAFGHDFTLNPAAMWTVAAGLTRYGVTAFLPTIITAPPGTIPAALTALAAGPPPGAPAGARPLGLHLEGPFLNPARRGAHPPEYLRLPDLTAADAWTPERGVRLVTLAPELPGAAALAERLCQRGVVVAAGHSAATYAEAQAGLAAGITYGTHLFNAMRPLDPREPGVAGALLTDARAVIGLIVDGAHLHPASVILAWRAKGPGSANLVTDAMAGLGMPPGRYLLGEHEVWVEAGTARLQDGRLAGSVLSLDQAVRNLAAVTGCSAHAALAAATEVPARVLGLSRRYGQLAVGGAADLVLLTPDLEVAGTWVGGRLVYHTERIAGRGPAGRDL